jgi:hypothetical protein
MSERLKKILLVTGFVVTVLAIGMAIYIVFFKPVDELAQVKPERTTVPEEAGTLPSAGEAVPSAEEQPNVIKETRLPGASEIAKGGITKTETLTVGGVTAPSLSSDGLSMAYYDKQDGRFYKINSDGDVETLSDKKFPNASNVTWNASSEKAVIEFPDGSNVVYDFEKEKQTTLPAHWEDFDFSPTTDQIIAKSIGLDSNNRALVITNSEGTNTKSIAALGNNADKVIVDWSPNDQIVAFSDTSQSVSGFGQKLLIPIGKNEENFQGVAVEGFDFVSQWNKQGNKLLYSSVSSYNGYKPMLWVVDGNANSIGNNRRSLGVETWADKCSFINNSTAYCAVPQNMAQNVGLQRSLTRAIADSIYKINIETGTKELVATPDMPQSIDSIRISGDESRLFFTNASTGVLQQIKLK